MTAARERREHARIRSTISVPRCARFAAVRRGGAKARDRFLASDPGLIRLFSAVSTVGGVLLTLLVLGLSGAPARVVLVGAMGAMAAGATVSDPRPGGKAITLAAAVPVGLLALSLGTVLAPHRVIADFALLLLIFTVVFVRRYGRRCDALGGIAFQFFFTAQFAHARPEQLPVLCSVVVLAIGSSAVVLLCLIRDTPERALRRLRHSFRARLAAVVDAMIAVAEAESGATATTALHRNTARLHQCALMIQSRLDTANVNPLVQRRIAEAETAAERLGVLLSRNGSTPDPGLAAELRALRLLLSQPHGLTPGTSPAGELRECHRALGELTRASARLRHAFGTATEEPGDQPAREEAAAETPSGLRHPGTRAAVQVTIGSAVAILGGELLSTQRWYWAMLACWVVYINTSSVGEVLLKGYRRLAGTFAGAFAGIGLAALVAGHVWTTFALVLLGLFGAFYLAAVSYLLMSLLITTMVGLLYTLLGTYSDAVLVLRIEETALGAASGLLAALLVLPQRTQRRTDEQLAEVLHRMRAFLGQACARPAGTPPGQLLDAARAVDTGLDAFRASAQPLIHPASPLRDRRSRARQLLGLLETSAYHARSLATTAAEDPRLAETGKSLAHNLSTVAELVRGDHASHAGDAASVARHARELEENVLCRSGSPRPVEVAVSHRPRPVTPRRPPGSAASRALPAGAPGTARGSRSSGSARSRAS
ncbi:FUSC family protein [Sciscionella sediminilitoris]|uniref:FUSC family protein n=1 Tax=Sciscionella sediminilitoris TaxID=1445613 RepID=UPI00068D2BC9|nr:FUSC family protein [Sciscionella sp. SE31]